MRLLTIASAAVLAVIYLVLGRRRSWVDPAAPARAPIDDIDWLDELVPMGAWTGTTYVGPRALTGTTWGGWPDGATLASWSGGYHPTQLGDTR